MKRPKPRGGAPPDRGRPAPKSDAIDRVHGFRAGLAILAARPGDVLRVACTREVLPEVERALAGRADDLHVGILGPAEIERLAHTPQHEGLCLEAKARAWLPAGDLADLLALRGGTAIALDRVRNSYNVGAVLRSAAFFGIDAAILGAPAPHPGLDPNALRVAEGGVEALAVARTTDLADTLGRLRARGVKVYGADGQGAAGAVGFPFACPAVLVMGNEREGLGPRIRAQCDAIVAIRGTGAVESLNVGVAAGVLLAELVRSRYLRGT